MVTKDKMYTKSERVLDGLSTLSRGVCVHSHTHVRTHTQTHTHTHTPLCTGKPPGFSEVSSLASDKDMYLVQTLAVSAKSTLPVLPGYQAIPLPRRLTSESTPPRAKNPHTHTQNHRVSSKNKTKKHKTVSCRANICCLEENKDTRKEGAVSIYTPRPPQFSNDKHRGNVNSSGCRSDSTRSAV